MSGKRGGVVGLCLGAALALGTSVATPAWGVGAGGYAWETAALRTAARPCR
jgi:hypothetical protein